MTWDQISAAIEQARTKSCDNCVPCWSGNPDNCHEGFDRSRNAHLDTLAAIHQLHWPQTLTHTNQTICGGCASVHQPCPDERVVIDALTRMGALPEGNDE